MQVSAQILGHHGKGLKSGEVVKKVYALKWFIDRSMNCQRLACTVALSCCVNLRMENCDRSSDLTGRRVLASTTMCILFLGIVLQTSPVFGRPSPSGGSAFSSPAPSRIQPMSEAGADGISFFRVPHHHLDTLLDPECLACSYDCGRLGTTKAGTLCCLECVEGNV